MIRKLEQHKKPYAVLFFILSTCIFIPISLFANNNIISIASAVLLLSHFIISVVYFIKGIADGVSCTVCYLLTLAGISVSLALKLFVKAPSFIDDNIFASTGMLIPLGLIIVVPLHKIIAKTIRGNLYENDFEDETTYKHIVNKHFGVETKELAGTPYNAFIDYRNIIKIMDLPDIFANAKPWAKFFRIATSIFLGVYFIIALLVTLNYNGKWDNPFATWIIWLCVTSVISGIVAVVVLTNGFIRGIVALLICCTLGFSGYYIYTWLQSFQNTPELTRLVLGILIIMIFVSICWIVFTQIMKNDAQTLSIIEDADCTYLVDLYLIDAFSIIEFKNCACIAINLATTTTAKNIDNFKDNLLLYCENRTFTAYVYYKNKKLEKALKRYFKKHLTLPYMLDILNDVEWELYKNELIPDDEIMIKSNNKSIIMELENNEFDFSTQVPFVLTAVFDDKENAIKFKNAVIKFDYTNVMYIDNSGDARKNNMAKKYYYQVYVQKSIRLREQWLNTEILKFNGLAKQFCGEYDSFEFGEIEPLSINEVEQ